MNTDAKTEAGTVALAAVDGLLMVRVQGEILRFQCEPVPCSENARRNGPSCTRIFSRLLQVNNKAGPSDLPWPA
jgi:hypothetical protein